MNAPTSNEPIAKPSTPVPNQVSADKPDPAIPFSDVNLNHWAKDYIQNMTARKAIEGYPDGKFKPENTVTRAEFAKIMVVSAGLKPLQPTSSSYADVGTSDWFLSYIEAAKSYLTGFLLPDGQLTYQPNSPALREDIAIAIVKLKGYDRTHKPDSAKLQSTFSDYNSISATARNYVSIAVETGLINGFDDKTFRAQEPITRSQAAALLWRAFQFGSDNKVELKSGTVTNATYGSPTVTQSTYGN